MNCFVGILIILGNFINPCHVVELTNSRNGCTIWNTNGGGVHVEMPCVEVAKKINEANK